MSKKIVDRRKKALEALQEDLRTGRIRVASSRTDEPLTDVQKKRITKEIETLKTRV